MQFRHFTKPYFCDILISAGEINPRKTKHERGNQMRTAYKYEFEIGTPHRNPDFVEAYAKTMSLYDFLKENGARVVKWENPTRGNYPTYVEVDGDGLPTGRYFSLLNLDLIKVENGEYITWGFDL